MDAVRTWIDEMPTPKGLAANEITAPPHAWLSERTGLTDGMLATTLIALFASGGIQPHPHKRDVWLLAGEGELDPEPARERLLTALDIITASGHHMTPSADAATREATPARTVHPQTKPSQTPLNDEAAPRRATRTARSDLSGAAAGNPELTKYPARRAWDRYERGGALNPSRSPATLAP
ncbi:hypothetical protein ACFUJT_34915 [Streptomyces griseoincarnatus]